MVKGCFKLICFEDEGLIKVFIKFGLKLFVGLSFICIYDIVGNFFDWNELLGRELL